MNNDPDNAKAFVFNMSINLWNFLFPEASKNIVASPRKKSNHKLKKEEAFFDLINRERLRSLMGSDSLYRISINALAQDWGWQRPTVKNFLAKLQSLGVLSFYSESLSTFVELHNIVGIQSLTSVASPSKERADDYQDS